MEIDVSEYTGKSLEELRASQEARKAGKNKPMVTVAATEEGKKHVKRVKTPDVVNFDKLLASVDNLTMRPQKEMKKTVNYKAARVLFWEILKKRMASVSGGEYIVKDADRDNSVIIENLVKYFINDDSGAYALHKGILLTGPVGTGKTFLIQSLAVLAQVVKNKRFRTAITNEIYDDLLQSSYDNKRSGVNLKRYFTGDWSFDDIGNEAAEFLHYGNPVRPMDRIFTERYKNWVNGWCLTHGTTNLTGSELETKYGKRVFDRMKDMFNVIRLDGESFRG